MAKRVGHEEDHGKPDKGEGDGVGFGKGFPVDKHTQQELERGIYIHEDACGGDAGLLDAAGKKHQGNGGHRPAEDQKDDFQAGQGGKSGEPRELCVQDKAQGQGQHRQGLHADGDLAPGPDALLQRPIQGEAQGDDNGQVRHIAIEHHGIHDPNESQSRGHPLYGGKSLPENQRADEDGEQGIHVIGQARLQYAPGSNREDINAPVCGNKQAAAQIQSALLFIPQNGPNGGAVLFDPYKSIAE